MLAWVSVGEERERWKERMSRDATPTNESRISDIIWYLLDGSWDSCKPPNLASTSTLLSSYPLASLLRVAGPSASDSREQSEKRRVLIF